MIPSAPVLNIGAATAMAVKTTTKAAAQGTAKPAKKATAKAAPAKASTPDAKSVAGAKPASKAVAKPAAPIVTTKQLSAEFGERQGVDKKQAEAAVAVLFEMLVAHLKSGDRVRIAGLGILEVKDRPARVGRNPATGEAVQIKASKKVAFRAAKDLKDAL